MVETSCKKYWNKETIEHTEFFHFTQITEKKLQFPFKNWQFPTFTSFSLHSWNSVDADFCISSACVTSGRKRSIWFYNIPASGGLNKKNMRKNMKFWPLNSYYNRSNWKTRLSERFSDALTSKLWNKKKTCCGGLQKWSEVELYSPPYGFIKNLQQIHLRDSHVNFTGKKQSQQPHVSKIIRLDWSKTAKQFSVDSREKFICQYQASREQVLDL